MPRQTRHRPYSTPACGRNVYVDVLKEISTTDDKDDEVIGSSQKSNRQAWRVAFKKEL